MSTLNIEIENIYNTINNSINIKEDYINIYKDIATEDSDYFYLTKIFGIWHYKLEKHILKINEKIKTHSFFYNKNDSEDLINTINYIFELRKKCLKTKYNFNVVNEVYKKIKYYIEWLSSTRGSSIPTDITPFTYDFNFPIFQLIEFENVNSTNRLGSFIYVGEGAYAIVYKALDSFLDDYIAIKQLNEGLDQKTVQRFEREFHFMKSHNHPFLLKAFKFYKKDRMYTMEYCDCNLYDFIKENSDLSNEKRYTIALQILEALKYIHSNGYFHRDLSLGNILINYKKNSGNPYVKVSDFGLLKDENERLTSTFSNNKGTFRDPYFDSKKGFNLQNEIYALGRVLNYVFFNKYEMNENDVGVFKELIDKCTTVPSKRYKSINEIITDINKIHNNKSL